MKRFFAILALLLLAGCGPRYDYSFAFEGDPADYPLAVAAVNSWNACGVVAARVSMGRDSGDQTPIQFEERIIGAADNVAGAYWGNLGLIEYTHKGDTQTEIAHEMGHRFGLGHFGSGLMSPTGLSQVPTAEDCRALANR